MKLAESSFWILEYATDLEEELVVEATTAPLGLSMIVDLGTPRSSPLGHPSRSKMFDQGSHDIAFQPRINQVIATKSACK